jgi:putative nucleotidyltransferase with HDIG domain
MKRKRLIKILAFALAYILIAAGFIFITVQDRSPAERTVMSFKADGKSNNGTFITEGEDPSLLKATITNSNFVLTIERTQFWAQGADKVTFFQHFGGEYKFQLKNSNNYSVSSWKLTIVFGKKTEVDSYWECAAETDMQDDKTVVEIKADPKKTKDQTIIVQESRVKGDNDRLNFGMVLHSLKQTPEIISVTLVAVAARSIYDNPLFWLLVVLSAAAFFGTILSIALYFRDKRYNRQKERDEKIIIQSINTFVNFVDAKDPYTKGHSTRVANYSAELAKRMKLPEEACKNLYYIALMHDVGKVSIPDSILQKPGKLDPEERKIIESHTTIGGQMLREFTALPGIVSGALYHHERYDGNGYPHRLSGEEIPLFARIICVADSYDAMSSRRCYRAKLSYEEIVRELNINAGKQFDPEIVKLMTDILSEAAANGKLSDYNL